MKVSGHGRTREVRGDPTAGASAGAGSWVVGSSAMVSVFWGRVGLKTRQVRPRAGRRGYWESVWSGLVTRSSRVDTRDRVAVGSRGSAIRRATKMKYVG